MISREKKFFSQVSTQRGGDGRLCCRRKAPVIPYFVSWGETVEKQGHTSCFPYTLEGLLISERGVVGLAITNPTLKKIKTMRLVFTYRNYISILSEILQPLFSFFLLFSKKIFFSSLFLPYLHVK